MTDVWTMGELLVEFIRPQPGTSRHVPGRFRGPYPSGAPGIFIDTVSRLGHSAGIVSGVGDDEFGACILDRLRRNGVRTDLVEIVPDRSTAVAFVTYRDDGSRRFIFHWDGTPAVMAPVPPPDRLTGARLFHVMGCSLLANDAFKERLFRTVELAAAGGTRITLDPNVRIELLRGRSIRDVIEPVLRHCSVLLPGEQELLALGGAENVEDCAKAMFDLGPLDLVVLKRGSRGCTIFARDEHIEVPAFPVREVDPTGAGDSFDAGFVCGLLEGRGLEACAELGAAVGALTASVFGPMEGRINPRSVARLMTRG